MLVGRDRLQILYDALSLHCIKHLQEAGDVSACNIVAFHAVLLGSFVDVVVDVDHDGLELGIDFFECPAQSLGVLAHFQSGGCYAACVGSSAGNEENAAVLQVLGRVEGCGHVSAFADCCDAVGRCSSFWVAQGSATSTLMDHTPRPS